MAKRVGRPRKPGKSEQARIDELIEMLVPELVGEATETAAKAAVTVPTAAAGPSVDKPAMDLLLGGGDDAVELVEEVAGEAVDPRTAAFRKAVGRVPGSSGRRAVGMNTPALRLREALKAAGAPTGTRGTKILGIAEAPRGLRWNLTKAASKLPKFMRGWGGALGGAFILPGLMELLVRIGQGVGGTDYSELPGATAEEMRLTQKLNALAGGTEQEAVNRIASRDPDLYQMLLNLVAGVPPVGLNLTDSEYVVGSATQQAGPEEVPPDLMGLLAGAVLAEAQARGGLQGLSEEPRGTSYGV